MNASAQTLAEQISDLESLLRCLLSEYPAQAAGLPLLHPVPIKTGRTRKQNGTQAATRLASEAGVPKILLWTEVLTYS